MLVLLSLYKHRAFSLIQYSVLTAAPASQSCYRQESSDAAYCKAGVKLINFQLNPKLYGRHLNVHEYRFYLLLCDTSWSEDAV